MYVCNEVRIIYKTVSDQKVITVLKQSTYPEMNNHDVC